VRPLRPPAHPARREPPSARRRPFEVHQLGPRPGRDWRPVRRRLAAQPHPRAGSAGGGGMKPAASFRSLLVTVLLFGGLGTLFVFGAAASGFSGPEVTEHWLAGAAHLGPWTLPFAVICFAGLAMLGVPQIVLVAAAVAAYGPEAGFVYSWIGNLAA